MRALKSVYASSNSLVVKQDRAKRFELTPVWAPVEPPAKRAKTAEVRLSSASDVPMSLPPSVTGRCSPLDHDVDSAAACNAPPPPSTGRCSPHDIVETSAPSCPGSSFPAYLGSHLSIVGCFWAWWRSQPPPHLHPNIRPYCRARKYLSSGAQWINVPKDVVEDLVVASKHSVLSSTETLQTINGCFSMPRTLVQSLVEVIDACVEGIPYVPLDEANMQARGLGSMVAFWERMRHICPKVNIYHGPIYGKDGAQCVTSHDLDEAMLATRDFWFQTPAEYDEEWQVSPRAIVRVLVRRL